MNEHLRRERRSVGVEWVVVLHDPMAVDVAIVGPLPIIVSIALPILRVRFTGSLNDPEYNPGVFSPPASPN